MTSGCEWIIDAAGGDAEALRSGERLAQLCAEIIADLELHVVGTPQWHQFPAPGGWTGMYLLSESHLTIHTFPELGLATLNLYCCRPRAAWDWEERLAELLGAEDVCVRCVMRGEQALLESTSRLQKATDGTAGQASSGTRSAFRTPHSALAPPSALPEGT